MLCWPMSYSACSTGHFCWPACKFQWNRLLLGQQINLFTKYAILLLIFITVSCYFTTIKIKSQSRWSLDFYRSYRCWDLLLLKNSLFLACSCQLPICPCQHSICPHQHPTCLHQNSTPALSCLSTQRYFTCCYYFLLPILLCLRHYPHCCYCFLHCYF